MSEHSPVKEAIFIPLTGVREEDRAEALLVSVSTAEGVLISDLGAFAQIPNAPLSYWLTPRCKRVPTLYQPLQSEGRAAKQGLATADDFRFLRLWWEIMPCVALPAGHLQKGKTFAAFHEEYAKQITDGRRWVPFAKGGAYSPYYADVCLVVNWGNNGEEIRHFKKPNTERLASRPQNIDCYFHPGLTWPLRTNGLSFRVMPSGCIFGHKGPCLFADSNDELLRLMAFLNTNTITGLVHALGVGRVEIQSYEVGTIQGIPVPPLNAALSQLAENGYMAARSIDTIRETSHVFTHPAALSPTKGLACALRDETEKVDEAQQKIAAIRSECERVAIEAYALSVADIESLRKLPGVTAAKLDTEDDEEQQEEGSVDLMAGVVRQLSWLVGAVFGRWDVRIALDQTLAPKLSDPFDPVPVCPPVMLVSPNGLPAQPNSIVGEEWLRARPDVNTLPPEGTVKRTIIPDSEYPLGICWNGILVDDPGHPDDIITRIRQVFDVIWQDKAHEIYAEAIEILDLGKDDLRPWFRANFFANHIKRYSQNRRKAPIYWCLSTPSRSYAVWLYYQRFSKDTFYKVLDCVKFKLQLEEQKLATLRVEIGDSPTSAQRRQLADQEKFVAELKTFHEEVALMAPLWKSDLNDGVIINFAPLWRLAPQPSSWQKECKQTWDALIRGEYDWAHLAMHLWPERVVPKCCNDRSLAIAHGLEESLWEQDEDGKWKPRDISRAELNDLIAARSSRSVKDALEKLLSMPATAGNGGRRRKG